jgi:hypothetical protein
MDDGDDYTNEEEKVESDNKYDINEDVNISFPRNRLFLIENKSSPIHEEHNEYYAASI